MESTEILVISATSDIGKEICRNLLSRNYRLSITGRNLEATKDLAEQLQREFDETIDYYLLDLTQFENHDKFMINIKRFPENVIFCAGYYQDQDKALRDFQESFTTVAVNYLGAISILNRFAVEFMKKNKGQITAISSVAGIRGRQMNYIYGSAKAGLTTYLSGLRNKLYKSKVTITTILLGPVYTKMSEGHSLIPVITLSPKDAAEKIINAMESKKDELYIHWIWRYIMLVIQLIPEFVFKRLRPF
jgi:short-subunit dehydrogenase